ncbi:hypothetical protein PQX77_012766 [Marasmius sp. AFHP31]|nr:hypothetical protein PQX77_012766 [Marasmius sp. AFHP31]
MYQHLNTRGLNYETHHEYGTPRVLMGMSLTIKDNSDLARLYSIPGVKAVHPVHRFPAPKPLPVSLAKRAAYATYDPKNAPASDALHAITGVDKLHSMGIKGKGIKIGIIDSGVDYNHPSLGGGFGPGRKIVGGKDYVGVEDISKPLTPDSDPMDCNGHGTHVSGIIGANPGNALFNVTGVAPEAELMVYKVAGCGPSIDEDSSIAALLQADQDGNDIITISLGGPSGWSSSAWSVAASRMAEKGRIVTVAAGNEGSDGPWFPGKPGSGNQVISVASVDTPQFPLQTIVVGGDVARDPIPYFDIFPLTNASDVAFPVFAFASDTACNPLAASVPNLEQFVVVTPFTTKCTIDVQLGNLKSKGAKLMLLYGLKSFGSISSLVGDASASLISTADGQFLSQQFFAKKKVTVTFPKGGRLVDFEQPTGGLVSDFTSYGPSFDLLFKPSIAAHGGQVLSTYPLSKGGFAILPGTSMSTPYMAGCAALYLQARGKRPEVAKQARDFFESTSVVIPASSQRGALPQTTIQQGAGMVDAFAAVTTQTFVSPGELLLNDTRNFKGAQTFTIKNLGSTPKKYLLRHQPASTAITIEVDSMLPSLGPVPLTDAPAQVKLTPSTFTLAPNAVQIVKAEFTEPTGLDKKSLPVYSGFIQVQADSDSKPLHVSYMGAVGSVYDQPVLDTTDTIEKGLNLPAVLLGSGGNGQSLVQKGSGNFVFKGDEQFPQLAFRFAFGTQHGMIDLVDPGLELSALPSKVPVVGPIFERIDVSRNIISQNVGEGFRLLGLNNNMTFANGSFVPDGTYKVMVRALRVSGNPDVQKDYDTWLSPALTFKFNAEARQSKETLWACLSIRDGIILLTFETA